MRNANAMQSAPQFAFPEAKECMQRRELGRGVEFLPKVKLQDVGMVRPPVMDLGGGQRIGSIKSEENSRALHLNNFAAPFWNFKPLPLPKVNKNPFIYNGLVDSSDRCIFLAVPS